MIEKIEDGLFRLKVPFEDLTTTVYFAVCETGTVIIDSATYASDADTYILPALDELGIRREDVKLLALTHRHGDHAGGASRLLEVLPWIVIRSFAPLKVPSVLLEDGELLLDRLQVVHLPGHSKDSAGYLDVTTGTLLSGDCLQLKGIGKYRNGISDREQYVASIQKLREMDIQKIVAAHEYDPLGSVADGAKEVQAYLDACIEVVETKVK